MEACEKCGQEKPDVKKWYYNQKEKEEGIFTNLCDDCQNRIEEEILAIEKEQLYMRINPEEDWL